ncbi:MAG: NAD-dependent epimerase/dehydratase family protein [Pseudomonadota bacterium]
MARKNTVLVTGGSGFIAKHIVLQLLNEGFAVRASVRSDTRADDIRAAMAAHARETDDLEKRLTFVTLDLSSDAGWDDALEGCSALMHTASPFPLEQPKDENDLIRPAVDGTLRALNAAQRAGVERVVLTSSMVAMFGKRLPAGRNKYDETDWTDLHSDFANAYTKSKTLAERAAWNFTRENSQIKLSTINPGLVLGPSLDARIGTSLGLVERLLEGKDPMVPRLGFPVVDVRDVAMMHVRALQREESIGNRYIAAERFMWMVDVANVLKSEYPDRKIATRVAPDWVMRIFSFFDKSIATILPMLGHEIPPDNSSAAEVLGIEFIDARQAIKTSASSLIRDGNLG